MRRGLCALLAAALLLSLAGCRRDVAALPRGREIEDMELMQTLGVDAAEAGQVAVTASSGAGDGPDSGATVVNGSAATLSAAVLGLQSEGASYLYFGHVGQLLAGEELARRGLWPTLDYVLRDVEMRLDTALYLVRGGEAGAALEAAARDGSAAGRLEAMAEDAGLLSGSARRTVKDAITDLYAQGATFLPAVTAETGLPAAGYGIVKDGALAAWAGEDAARGINLLLGSVEADVVELPLDGGGTAALRVVGASSSVRPVVEGGTLTGLSVICKVEANLAEGDLDLRDEQAARALEEALARVEHDRAWAALSLARELDADYLGLLSRAALARPWHKAALERAALAGLELELSVEAELRRGYDAARQEE